MKEKLGVDMWKEHEELNNLRFLFITGELSTANALGKYMNASNNVPNYYVCEYLLYIPFIFTTYTLVKPR